MEHSYMWCAKGHQRAYGKRGKRGLAGERMDLDVEWRQGNSRRDGRGRQDRQRETESRWKRGQKGIEGVSTDKYLAISLCAPRREHKHKAVPSVSNPRE